MWLEQGSRGAGERGRSGWELTQAWASSMVLDLPERERARQDTGPFEKSSDMTRFFKRTIPAALWQTVRGKAGSRDPVREDTQ